MKSFKAYANEGDYIGILGTVYHDGSLEFKEHYPVKGEFDLNTHNEFLSLMTETKIKSLFY